MFHHGTTKQGCQDTLTDAVDAIEHGIIIEVGH